MTNKPKIIVAVTGASGSVYAEHLLEKLRNIPEQYMLVDLVFSENAKFIWKSELKKNDYNTLPFRKFDNKDFLAPFASGSAKYDTMIICPCSMGTLARIANGISNDLISRAADVILKEHKKLILVTRETPLSLIHIENMRKISLSGGIICPANPSFYSNPLTVDELVSTVVDRILDLAGFNIDTFRWSTK